MATTRTSQRGAYAKPTSPPSLHRAALTLLVATLTCCGEPSGGVAPPPPSTTIDAVTIDPQSPIFIVSSTFGEGRGQADTTEVVQRLVDEHREEVVITTPGLGIRNRSGAFRQYLIVRYRIGELEATMQFANAEKVNLRDALLAHFAESVKAVIENH